MPEVKFERCLTMSAYAAFLSLRRYLQSYPSSSIEAAIETLCRINSDASSLDYVGAAVLNQFISRDVELDYRLGLQAVIKEVLECGRPWWLRLVPYGREKVRSALSEDQIQCFRDAGLFDLIPDPDIVAWWDELASMVRGSADAERVVQGREAERLSFDRERKRLRELGINEDPAWVALEDNTLGYDIRSYDLKNGSVVSTLIEVKSAKSEIIFVTRNEWNNAVSAGNRYVFHIWRMPEAELRELSAQSIGCHIPSDRGDGLWQDVKISLSP